VAAVPLTSTLKGRSEMTFVTPVTAVGVAVTGADVPAEEDPRLILSSLCSKNATVHGIGATCVACKVPFHSTFEHARCVNVLESTLTRCRNQEWPPRKRYDVGPVVSMIPLSLSLFIYIYIRTYNMNRSRSD
jgi:hypothetical protein